MIEAAEKFDVTSLLRIVGHDGEDVVLTGQFAQDRERAEEFAAQARTKKRVSVDPKSGRAWLLVGEQEWPFALPIVKRGGRWSFDVAAGRDELFNRRIGSNELDAISICHGFVEAQYDYAFRKREGYDVAQYAQRVISTPGKRDGGVAARRRNLGRSGRREDRTCDPTGLRREGRALPRLFLQSAEGAGAKRPVGSHGLRG
jgi:hypothetical protein